MANEFYYKIIDHYILLKLPHPPLNIPLDLLLLLKEMYISTNCTRISGELFCSWLLTSTF